MFFAAVFSICVPNEIIAFGSGNSIGDVIFDLENADIGFDEYFDSGNVQLFEGDAITLRQVCVYEIE